MKTLILSLGVVIIIYSVISYLINNKKYYVETIDFHLVMLFLGIAIRPMIEDGVSQWSTSLVYLIGLIVLFVLVPFKLNGVSKDVNSDFTSVARELDQLNILKAAQVINMKEGKTYRLHDGTKVRIFKAIRKNKSRVLISSGFNIKRIMEVRQENSSSLN